MNPRIVISIAADVLREAIFSRYLLVLFGFILLGLIGLTLSLDLEVVDGAIAAAKLFRDSVLESDSKISVDEFIRPIIQFIAYATFYGGLLLLIVVVADIAPKMLRPGRVELLLSLPIRRTELVVGTYLGAVAIAALATTFTVFGSAAVLFVKADFFTPAPIMAVLCVMVGFMTVYGVMLLAATLARSAALSSASGILLYIVAISTSDREPVVYLFPDDLTRSIVWVLLGPLPRFRALAEYGAASFQTWQWALPVMGGSLALGLFALVLACVVVQLKDY